MVDDSDCLIRVDGQIQKVTGRKQFIRLFPDKTRELEEFIGNNNTDFRSAADLTELVKFCNGLSR